MPQLVWLITGCSSGFGEQFVYRILARGDKVIATARNMTKIQHLEQAGASVFQLDIKYGQESIDAIVNQTIEIYGRIDVLVNNAAYVAIGTWEDLKYEDFLAQFNTNVFGTIKITRALLPHLRHRRKGVIVFISSLSGWIGHPGVGAYAGSKFALEGMVESLSQEISSFGIKTLLIEPGRFRTNLLSSGNMRPHASSIGDYADLSTSLLQGLANENLTQPGDPKKLVEITLDVVRREGIVRGKDVPLRLPLGSDVYYDIKAKCEETLRVLETWKEVITSTDFDE